MLVNWTREKEDAFFEAIEATANITRSCELAGVPRSGAYHRRRSEPYFAERWDACLEIGIEALEDEARRRAFEGVERKHFKNGELVGVTKDYSDTLAIFLLKGAKPDVYKDRLAAEHTGKDGGAIKVETDVASVPDAISDLLRIAASRREQDGSDLA